MNIYLRKDYLMFLINKYKKFDYECIIKKNDADMLCYECQKKIEDKCLLCKDENDNEIYFHHNIKKNILCYFKEYSKQKKYKIN